MKCGLSIKQSALVMSDFNLIDGHILSVFIASRPISLAQVIKFKAVTE